MFDNTLPKKQISESAAIALVDKDRKHWEASQTATSKTLLNVSEIAALLGISVGTIYYWVSRNGIPYIKFGRHLRFIPDEVLSHFKRMTEEKKPACFKPCFSLEVRGSKHCSLKNQVSAESAYQKKGN